MTTTLISLGGSIIVPDKIDTAFLKRFKKLVLDYIKRGNRMIIVCGGGRTCRTYQQASAKLAKVNDIDKDWVGIMATRLNAELVRVMFKDHAFERVVYDPHEKIRTRKKIIIGAGHVPGCTTDTDTAILAKQFKAHMIINTSNIDYVYDKDPAKHKDAKKITALTWKEFFHMFGKKHHPGAHVPFDPIASDITMKNKMKVAIINGRKLDNLKKLLEGKKFRGTIIG
jgi:uridylate kinase